MNGQDTPQASAADWYPDPSHRHEFRYFDGTTWTQQVSDAGQVRVDFGPVVAAEESVQEGESLLLTLPDTYRSGSPATAVVYLTDRRLVVDPAMSSSKSMKVAFSSGVFGQVHAEKLAKERHQQEGPVDVASLDAILTTVDGAFQMPYGDMAAVEMKRKSHYCRVKITGNGEVTLVVKHEFFDPMAAVLTEAMPGRVTIK